MTDLYNVNVTTSWNIRICNTESLIWHQ